jgi:hypothetical protein
MMHKRGISITLLSTLLLVLAFSLALAATLHAQAPGSASPGFPGTINYQGMLRQPDGKPVADGPYAITVAIYDAVTGGAPIHTETFNRTTVRDGIFNVVLGADANNPLKQSVFDHAPLYMGIKVGEDSEMTPRQRVHAVPWALQAAAITPGVTLNDLKVNNLTAAGTTSIRGIASISAISGTTSITGWLSLSDYQGITQTKSITGWLKTRANPKAGIQLFAQKDNWGFLITKDDKAKSLNIDGAAPALTIAQTSGDVTALADLKSTVIRDNGESTLTTAITETVTEAVAGVKVTRDTYERSLRRYVVTAKLPDMSTPISKTLLSKLLDKPVAVPVNETLLAQLCGDEDGCSVTLAMKDTDGTLASNGPFRFSLSLTGKWVLSRQEPSSLLGNSIIASGTDGDKKLDQVWGYKYDYTGSGYRCFFKDIEYNQSVKPGNSGIEIKESDDDPGFTLYRAPDSNDQEWSCMLIIDD